MTVSVTASGSGSTATPAISSVANGASFKTELRAGIDSERVRVAAFAVDPERVERAAADFDSGVAVLVNGIAAPLYYVSPGQLNVQIPYETAANGTAMMSVNNNGQVTTQSFQVAAAAPGIFTDSTGALVPTASAALGQEIAFYITGAGAVSPAIATGAAPAASTAHRESSEAGRRSTMRDHRRSHGDHRFHRHSCRDWWE